MAGREPPRSFGLKKIKEFLLGQEIGSGSFSKVRIGQELTTGNQVAIKIIQTSSLKPHERECVAIELDVLRQLRHPHIVRHLDDLSDDETTFIVMEYVQSGSLFSHAMRHPDSKLKEKEAKRLIQQVLQAIAYCHQQNIAHRDLKLEHVLLDANCNVKIIDFGLACRSPPEAQSTMYCGSHLYSAPEILNHIPYFPHKVDIWAIGIILYVLLYGRFPFFSKDEATLIARITAGTLSFPRDKYGTGPTPQAQEIILKMISHNPLERPTCEDLLSDPWFSTAPLPGLSSDDDDLNDDDFFS